MSHHERPNRRSIRHPGHDYARGGLYFITLVTAGRRHLFGRVRDGVMHSNALGRTVREVWYDVGNLHPRVRPLLNAYRDMPNHAHGVVEILPAEGDTRRRLPQHLRILSTPAFGRRQPGSLGEFIGAYKAASTRAVNAIRGTPGEPLWQRNYYERIVRDEAHLERILAYIKENPEMWERDLLNPDCGDVGPRENP